MTCKHSEEDAVRAVIIDGFCPTCAYAQLVLAENVVEAADNFLDAVDYDKPGKEVYADKLRDAIAKFKGGQDDNS